MNLQKGQFKCYLFSFYLLFEILFCSSSFGATIIIPTDKPTIQAGIDASSNGDIILVLDGIYSGIGNKNIKFKGKEITVRSENGPNSCIIDCEEDGRGFYFNNDEENNSILDGFTIKNGYSSEDGGGIYCFFSSPTITNCIISNNIAGGGGGGIRCSESSPKITNCIINNNSADSGAGIDIVWNSSPIITNCQINNNTANTSGGGVNQSGSLIHGAEPLTISGCSVNNNVAGWGGGGIFCMRSEVNITGCIISSNSASELDGGGISCIGYSRMTITDSTIDDNIARIDGGGIFFSTSTTYINNCIIRNNTTLYANGNGGGIAFKGSGNETAEITNCIFNGNTSISDGGGIFFWGKDINDKMYITNCTITNNSGEIGGGVYYVFYPVTIKNSIIWANFPNELGSYKSEMAIITYSDVKGNYSGIGNINADPLFLDPNNDDFRLTETSSAIDTGDSEGAPDSDIEGNPRPQGGGYDMGAYESEYTNKSPIVLLTIPNKEAINVPVNTIITVNFSDVMNPLSITNDTFLVNNGIDNIGGITTCSGNTATFTPDDDLGHEIIYSVTITTEAEDLAGNNLESDYKWTFITEAEIDTTVPTVDLTSPAGNIDDVTVVKWYS